MFKYNNKNLEDFGLRLLNDLTFASPEEDVDFVEIKGRDGVVTMPNNRLDVVKRTFEFYINTKGYRSIEEASEQLINHLRKDKGFFDLEWTGDTKHIYKAMHHEVLSVGRINDKLGRVDLTFTMHPVKYVKGGFTEVPLGTSINNPTSRPSSPRLKITGTGNITIKIGKDSLVLKNVDGGVIVDSQSHTITDLSGTRPQWDKVTSYPFPKISTGSNAVTKTGSVTSITVIPRWEVVI